MGRTNISSFSLWLHRKCLPLHPQLRQRGALVQLVRMPACHAGGHEFESRTHRLKTRSIKMLLVFRYIVITQVSGFSFRRKIVRNIWLQARFLFKNRGKTSIWNLRKIADKRPSENRVFATKPCICSQIRDSWAFLVKSWYSDCYKHQTENQNSVRPSGFAIGILSHPHRCLIASS